MPAKEPDKCISYLPFHQIRGWQQAPRTEGSPWLARPCFDGAAATDHNQKATNKRASPPENKLHRVSTGSTGT